MDQEPKKQNSRRLLVIDDDTQVGPMLKAILEKSGYDVILEPNGRKAMKNFRHQGGDFDLVITDQRLPGISGFEIARELKKIRPEVPIIICSGSSPFDFPGYESSEIQAYLMKPFGSTQLLSTVARYMPRNKLL